MNQQSDDLKRLAEARGDGMKTQVTSNLESIHKFTGTFTFEFYGEPGLSTTDVFKYKLLEDFKEDPDFMLDDIKWTSTPIEIVQWKPGMIKDGEFIPEEME